MRVSDKLSAVLAALAAAGAAFGLVPAPTAHADELSYLQALNANGIVVYNTAAVLSNGYLACNMMNTYTGDVVAALPLPQRGCRRDLARGRGRPRPGCAECGQRHTGR